MHGHAVLLPFAALVDPAGVGVRLLVGQRGPGEAAQGGADQADVAPPAVLRGNVVDDVGVGAAHQPAVLPILAVGSGDLVGGQELAVHPDVSLHVGETREHLRPSWREHKRVHGVHVLSLVRHHYPAEQEAGRDEQVQLHVCRQPVCPIRSIT